ncbi:glutathione S-transferase N-terminal domain-containing protein [uncultured Erythrobacter sp.]|uniref:glutathione S-transferase N-terminal domain-containing protein n=1 Tax=uncultured Erythrobacter sp. TaxID=263913 RepID=UPI00261D1DA6|nr:glutathione S-transferase N-terminal domain-containing protein [uncultured Erythrobacter sp.]
MYTIHGALGSPYSMKMRALMRYRRITHVWSHGSHVQQLAAQNSLPPVIPVIEYPDGSFRNDSTPVLYDLETRHTDRSVIPTDPAQAFIAHLLEDFADEWLTKAMFGYRWLEEVDQLQMSRWLSFDALKGGGLETSQGMAKMFRERQVGRMAIVGCTRENFALIENSTRRVMQALEDHVANEHWLFGTRPSLAELGIYGQLSQLGVDPTAQAMMRADYPYTFRWLLHVDDASGIEGEWDEANAPLRPVVQSLLAEVGRVYVPFLLANEAAAQGQEKTFRIEVDDMPYEQGTFKYQLKCLADLRARYAALTPDMRAQIDPVLEVAGCKEFLQ